MAQAMNHPGHRWAGSQTIYVFRLFPVFGDAQGRPRRHETALFEEFKRTGWALLQLEYLYQYERQPGLANQDIRRSSHSGVVQKEISNVRNTTV